jgi:glycosyltransferase involved in cell wall biosynthesis
MPLFTVIIPTYNRLKLLKESLQSIYTQTFTDYEIIVIDDGSTDGTLEYLQTLAPRIQIYRQENKGPGAARNLGAIHAQGDYLAFLDSDDLWFPWTLSSFHSVIKKYRYPSIVSGNLILFNKKADLTNISHQPLKEAYYKNVYSAYKDVIFIGAGMCAVKKTVYDEILGFNENLRCCEDHDFILRIGLHSDFVQIQSPLTLACRKHSSNTSSIYKNLISDAHTLIHHEKNARYPGGIRWQRVRQIIISRHIRPIIMSLFKKGEKKEAFRLFISTFTWHFFPRR